MTREKLKLFDLVWIANSFVSSIVNVMPSACQFDCFKPALTIAIIYSKSIKTIGLRGAIQHLQWLLIKLTKCAGIWTQDVWRSKLFFFLKCQKRKKNHIHRSEIRHKSLSGNCIRGNTIGFFSSFDNLKLLIESLQHTKPKTFLQVIPSTPPAESSEHVFYQFWRAGWFLWWHKSIR